MKLINIFCIILILGCTAKNDNVLLEDSLTNEDSIKTKASYQEIENIFDLTSIDYRSAGLNEDATKTLEQEYGFYLFENDSNLLVTCLVKFHFNFDKGFYRLDDITIERKEHFGFFGVEGLSHIIERFNLDSIYVENVRFYLAVDYNDKGEQIEMEEFVSENTKRVITRTKNYSVRISTSFEVEFLTPQKMVLIDDNKLMPNRLYQQHIRTEQSRISGKYKGILIGLEEQDEIVKIRENNKIVFVPLNEK